MQIDPVGVLADGEEEQAAGVVGDGGGGVVEGGEHRASESEWPAALQTGICMNARVGVRHTHIHTCTRARTHTRARAQAHGRWHSCRQTNA